MGKPKIFVARDDTKGTVSVELIKKYTDQFGPSFSGSVAANVTKAFR